MAIVVLVLWVLTVAVGVYLLASSTRLKGAGAETAAKPAVPERTTARYRFPAGSWPFTWPAPP